MTESEAKTKWCPMARLSDGSALFNRYLEGTAPSSASCLGSGCACWIWDKEPNVAIMRNVPEFYVQEEIKKREAEKLTFLYEVPDGRLKVMNAPDAITYSLYFEREPEKRQGHCGLCNGGHYAKGN